MANLCLRIIPDTNRVVKSSLPRQLGVLARQDYNGIPGTLISWATPGETTQAGIRQGAGREDYKLSAGSSLKLTELPLPRGSFFIRGAGKVASTQVEPSSEERQGPQQE